MVERATDSVVDGTAAGQFVFRQIGNDDVEVELPVGEN